MYMCRVVCVVERGCLLWPVHSLGKTLLTFALLRFVLQGQTCLLLQVSLDFLLLYSSPLWWQGHLFCLFLLVLEGLVGHHRTIQLQHYWLGYGLGLLWYWMVCLGNEQRSFRHFWDCTQVLHFKVFHWLWGLFHVFLGILAHSSRAQLCDSLSILWHCLSLGLGWKLTFSSPVACWVF